MPPSNEPNLPSMENHAGMQAKRRRIRTPSAVMLENMETEKLRQEDLSRDKARSKRKYTKRKKETDSISSNQDCKIPLEGNTANSVVTNGDTLEKDLGNDIDENMFVCCVCLSDVDYTEVLTNDQVDSDVEDNFEEMNTVNGAKSDEIATTTSTKVSSVVVKENRQSGDGSADITNKGGCTQECSVARLNKKQHYDPHNALLLCDTVSCNRAYHQHCHFVPLFTVPRGKWYCLICQYQQLYQQKRKHSPSLSNISDQSKKIKKGRPRKGATIPASIIENTTVPFVFTPKIYPPPHCNPAAAICHAISPNNKKEHGTLTKTSGFDPSTKSNASVNVTPQHLLFENFSSPLKKHEVAQSISRVRSAISQCIGQIRASSNTIRIYTESSRSRKSLLSAASKKENLPAELVLSKQKLLTNQYRIRTLLQSMQHYIEHGGVSENLNGRKEPRCAAEQDHGEDNTEIGAGDKGTNRSSTSGDLVKKTTEYMVIKESTICCSLCFSSASTDENDIILCDGMSCDRAFHMKCLEPEITAEQLKNDPDGTWFCPYCTSVAELVHYVQDSIYGEDDGGMGDEWESVNNVFEGVEEEMEEWGMKNGVSVDEGRKGIVVKKQIVLQLLGMSQENDINQEFDDEEDEDEEDFDPMEKKETKKDDDDFDSKSDVSESLEDISSIECEIEQSEVDALSCNEDSDDENNADRPSRRRKKAVNEDEGRLDEKNILQGKRRRTKVDYRRLNDAMFGQLGAQDAARLFGDEKNDMYETDTSDDNNKKSFHAKTPSHGRKSTGDENDEAQPTKKKKGRPKGSVDNKKRIRGKNKSSSPHRKTEEYRKHKTDSTSDASQTQKEKGTKNETFMKKKI